MKISLNSKIQGGFLLCCIALIVGAVISFRSSRNFVEAETRVNESYEILFELEQLRMGAIEAESSVRGFVIAGRDEFLIPYEDSRAYLKLHMDKMHGLTANNSQQSSNVRKLDSLTKQHFAYLDSSVALYRADTKQGYARIASGDSRKILQQIRNVVKDAHTAEAALLAQRKQTSTDDNAAVNFVFITLMVVIISVLGVIYVIITNNLKKITASERVMSEKNWTLEGSGDLTDGMQGNQSLQELGQVAINHFVSHLQIALGAFYLIVNNQLHLIAGHALGKGKLEHKTILLGEGVAGQAAADRKPKIQDGITSGYFAMPTAFGDVLPQSVVAFPLIFEDRVVGVIELAHTAKFSPQQIQYLHTVANSISVAIVSAKAREEVKELLEETRKQAEEMEMQQQELKQTNEELHFKTELLEKSELELKAQQEELQQANVELENRASVLEVQKEKLEEAKIQIEEKAKEVEISSKYKSEFLANMSHELRTPLNSILILAQLLGENKHNRLGEKEVEHAKNIEASGNGLLNLINEILDLSKIEAGKMELDIEDVPITDITHPILAMFTSLAQNKGIKFNVTVAPDVSQAVIKTDGQRVEQIIRNLLSNAFKFTKAGGSVNLEILRETPKAGAVNDVLKNASAILAFKVTDTGIGIPKDKRELIFQAFQQADGSTKRKYGGTGLGLSISRELAYALGGEIHLASEEGKGSAFTLYLPFTYEHATGAPLVTGKQVTVKKEPVKEKVIIPEVTELILQEGALEAKDDRFNVAESDKVILIIEDDEKFSSILLDFVRTRKYKGVVASQGSTGITFARHYKPVAILLDINLPVMDGYEVLRQLKHDPSLRHIPVQIISAHDQEKQGLRLGAFDFLSKPVSLDVLNGAFDRIEKFTNKKLKKLLIVEDNQQQNNAIRELIGNGDVKCFSAYEGRSAYEMLRADSFDCIIVDLGLPDMTGFELMEKIKADPQLSRIPIVVYTGRDLGKEDNNRLHRLADTVVLKTAESHERLLDEAILFLHRVESNLPKEQQTLIRKLHKTDELLSGKNILVVDDDIRNIYSLTNALEEEGVNCLIAENGKVALDTLKEHPEVDLILMDIMMPEMDGYEATIEIRKLDQFKKLPIIALTAKAMKGDKEKCLSVGMSDYVSKPLNISQLFSLMRVWLYK